MLETDIMYVTHVHKSASLHAGQQGLCTSFHNVQDPEHFLHAPVRQFYQQALELFFEAPTLLLKLWHSLACGHDNAGKVFSSAVHYASEPALSRRIPSIVGRDQSCQRTVKAFPSDSQ